MRHRRIELARGGWGLLALAAPGHVLRALGGSTGDRRARSVVRVLGARHLAQAALSGVAPTPSVLATGVWVDAVHALTAIALAAVQPVHATPALADAGIAATWAWFGDDDLRHGGRGEGEERRSRWGRAVLGVVPGGGPLLRQADAARSVAG